MRNVEKEEVPLLNIERNPLVLITSALICAAFVYSGYTLLRDVNPWGFIVLIPGSVLFFQTLWFLVNPFALVFDNKIEIKQSFFHSQKMRYYIDIKKVNESKNGRIYITYNDDETEKLSLFGIKSSHTGILRAEMEKFVAAELQKRASSL